MLTDAYLILTTPTKNRMNIVNFVWSSKFDILINYLF